MFVKLIYVRCRAQPTLHQCVVIWAGEGMRYVCEAIGESIIFPFFPLSAVDPEIKLLLEC